MKPQEFLLRPEEVTVDLDKLKLDVHNVRFAHLNKQLTEDEVEKAIWDEADTKLLYDQIKSTKGLYEKPVINSEYIVIEGNRRITCLRKLKKEVNEGNLPDIPKNKFDLVTCYQLPADATDQQIKLYLAAIHVKGKKEWPTFNRAKQIYELNKLFNLSYDFLSKHLGMGKSTVIRAADVYEQTQKYGDKHPKDTEWYRKYTYFDELFKRKDLIDFRKLQKNIDMFGDWVFQEKFNDVRDVRALAQVLQDEDAKKVFQRSKFEDAFKLLETKNPAIKSREFKKIGEVIEIIRSFPRKELVKTMGDPARRKMLEKLKDELQTLKAIRREMFKRYR